MSILTCISLARHPASGRLMPTPGDLKAALLAKDLGAGKESPLQLLHLVPAGHSSTGITPAIREYGCYGLPRIALAESHNTHASICSYARQSKAHFIFFGQRSGAVGSRASGMLPYRVAKTLGLPLLELACAISEQGVVQFLPAGNRRTLPVPEAAVITVHPQAAVAAPYAHRLGQLCTIEHLTLQSEETDQKSTWQVQPRTAFHQRISIASNASGMERMRKAIAVANQGGEVVTSGNAQDHARRIIATLHAKHLL